MFQSRLRSIVALQKTLLPQTRRYHLCDRIGNRDVVGFGTNGSFTYRDDVHFPFPAVRFMENSPMVCMLRQREKCDWKMLSCEEKKALYRASFCQTFAEFQASTGLWKLVLGSTFFMVGCACWMFTFVAFFVNEPRPDSLKEESQQKQLRRMLDLHVNPIDGLASKWDYANERWK